MSTAEKPATTYAIEKNRLYLQAAAVSVKPDATGLGKNIPNRLAFIINIREGLIDPFISFVSRKPLVIRGDEIGITDLQLGFKDLVDEYVPGVWIKGLTRDTKESAQIVVGRKYIGKVHLCTNATFLSERGLLTPISFSNGRELRLSEHPEIIRSFPDDAARSEVNGNVVLGNRGMSWLRFFDIEDIHAAEEVKNGCVSVLNKLR